MGAPEVEEALRFASAEAARQPDWAFATMAASQMGPAIPMDTTASWAADRMSKAPANGRRHGAV